MANPSKAKGSLFEKQVCEYLASYWPDVERRVQAGANDRGDVAGIHGWVVELKATKQLDLAGALREAELEAQHAGVRRFVAVFKRRQQSVTEAYAVMPLWLWALVVYELEKLQP
jgi:hypothetical protein